MLYVFDYMAFLDVSRLRIVDDDIDLAAVAPSVEEADAKEAELLDDAPTIVDIIDDRPAHIKQMEAYNSGSRWKKIQQGLYNHQLAVVTRL